MQKWDAQETAFQLVLLELVEETNEEIDGSNGVKQTTWSSPTPGSSITLEELTPGKAREINVETKSTTSPLTTVSKEQLRTPKATRVRIVEVTTIQ